MDIAIIVILIGSLDKILTRKIYTPRKYQNIDMLEIFPCQSKNKKIGIPRWVWQQIIGVPTSKHALNQINLLMLALGRYKWPYLLYIFIKIIIKIRRTKKKLVVQVARQWCSWVMGDVLSMATVDGPTKRFLGPKSVWSHDHDLLRWMCFCPIIFMENENYFYLKLSIDEKLVPHLTTQMTERKEREKVEIHELVWLCHFRKNKIKVQPWLNHTNLLAFRNWD